MNRGTARLPTRLDTQASSSILPRMRTYAYLLPLPLLLLPACTTTPLCGDNSNCATEGTSTDASTDASTGTSTGTSTDSSTTGEPTTGEPGTSTEPATSTDSTTDTPGTSSSSTGDSSTTDDPSTTGDMPVFGDPAVFGEACAPDDGPAAEFKLLYAERKCDSDWPEDAPIFRIVLFEGVEELAVGDYPLDQAWAFVSYDEMGNPLAAKGGTLSITGLTMDGLHGTYDITLVDDTQLTGEFDALYCPVDVNCG